ncbi:hypothetical protein, partial [Burkholderia stagnalis]|uniref:hypothetical protein n=1 Tax=Burkholderia stagnalis TaxID=1503054 RepID=UPI0028931E88
PYGRHGFRRAKETAFKKVKRCLRIAQLIWLALRNVVAKWTGSRHDWKSAMTQFALLYPERFNIGV